MAEERLDEDPATDGIRGKRQRLVEPSAAQITVGVVLLFLGQFVYNAGAQANLRDVLTSPSSSGGSGDTALLVGGVLALVGLIALVLGVLHLATNIDLVAEHIANRRQERRDRK